MGKYLGTAWTGPGRFRLFWDDEPYAALRGLGGRSSPVFPLRPPQLEQLPENGVVAILFPRSPRRLASIIQSKDPERPDLTAFVTHGLASVVLIGTDLPGIQKFVGSLSQQLSAYEVWPVLHGVVSLNDTNLWFRRNDSPNGPNVELDTRGLTFEIAAEVRQLNANLTLLGSTISRFSPEMLDLVNFVRGSVSRRLDRARRKDPVDTGSASARELESLHEDLNDLVDINSCIVMLNSQLGGCLPPVINSDYPVGEFSLFGIGSMVRGAWRIYAHMASVFGGADHPQRLRQQFPATAFDPGVGGRDVDRQSWERSAQTSSIDAVHVENKKPPRRHVVYFSARWGFHETVNSITLSWQSLTFGASPRWTFLTFSHEFLHSHFREVVRSNVMDVRSPQQLDGLVAEYNSTAEGAASPADFKRSLQFFLIRQMISAEDAERSARSLPGGGPRSDPPVRQVTQDDVLRLMSGTMPDFIEEVLVHVMDYHYFFDADDTPFVTAMWSSWTFVPTVHRRLQHYLLRTVLALSSQARSMAPQQAFEDAVARLRVCFRLVQESEISASGLVLEALAALAHPQTLQQLWVRFRASYELVIFANFFLIDRDIYSALVEDDQAVPGSGHRYRLDVGEFPKQPIDSPTGFLLDRLSTIASERTIQFETLWEFLLLVEGGSDDAT